MKGIKKMSQYEVGLHTKEKIKSSARELFYESGYKKISLQEIAKNAGIRQSLLYYYYKNKDELASEIFNEFTERHNSLLLNKFSKLNLNLSILIERCVFVASNYRVILSNKSLALFIGEINESDVQMSSEFIRDKYRILMEENPVSMKMTNIDFVMLENIGLNTAIFHLYTKGHLTNFNIDQLIRFKLRTILRSIYYEECEIDTVIEEIILIESNIKFIVEPRFELTLDK